MKLYLGSKTILCNWYTRKSKIPKKVVIDICNMLSLGITDGHFHYCFDGVEDSLGWWICVDE